MQMRASKKVALKTSSSKTVKLQDSGLLSCLQSVLRSNRRATGQPTLDVPGEEQIYDDLLSLSKRKFDVADSSDCPSVTVVAGTKVKFEVPMPVIALYLSMSLQCSLVLHLCTLEETVDVDTVKCLAGNWTRLTVSSDLVAPPLCADAQFGKCIYMLSAPGNYSRLFPNQRFV